jgi:hypothetical protein
MTERRTDNAQLAEDFLNEHFPENWARRDYGSHYAISEDDAPHLAEMIQDLIANIVASILDAGSERDAVNENEELRAAIDSELDGWIIHEPEGETNK